MPKYYAVYDTKENLVMVGNAHECANFMSLTAGSFKSHVSRVKKGIIKGTNRYKAYLIEEELESEIKGVAYE